MSGQMKQIIEALLFVSDAPLSLAQICKVMETEDRAQVKAALDELNNEYQGTQRAFALVEVAGGFRLRTRTELGHWLRKLRHQQVTRLSAAALETLAIVAYKQPVLKAEVERLRGVEVSGVLRLLLEKDLVKVVGRKDLPGRPLIYGTTKRFLETFDLKDLKDLPTLKEMEAILGEVGLLPEQPEGPTQQVLDLGKPQKADPGEAALPDETGSSGPEDAPKEGEIPASETILPNPEKDREGASGK